MHITCASGWRDDCLLGNFLQVFSSCNMADPTSSMIRFPYSWNKPAGRLRNYTKRLQRIIKSASNIVHIFIKNRFIEICVHPTLPLPILGRLHLGLCDYDPGSQPYPERCTTRVCAPLLNVLHLLTKRLVGDTCLTLKMRTMSCFEWERKGILGKHRLGQQRPYPSHIGCWIWDCSDDLLTNPQVRATLPAVHGRTQRMLLVSRSHARRFVLRLK